MKRLTIEQVHSRLLDMAKVIHKICEDNAIPYYLLGGSMLGAIRHKGFIPWDDDMDLGIPREFYKKFFDVASKGLPDKYAIYSHHTSDFMIQGFVKIAEKDTRVEEIYTTKQHREIGINIDVFPLDDSNGAKGVLSKNHHVRMLIKLQKLLQVDSSNRKLPKKVLSGVVQHLVPLKKNRIPDFLERVFERKSENGKQYSHYSNFYGAWGLKETISKSIFGRPTLYAFEDAFFYGAADYDAYLSSLYGDYMQLPPEEKRGAHSVSAYSKE